MCPQKHRGVNEISVDICPEGCSMRLHNQRQCFLAPTCGSLKFVCSSTMMLLSNDRLRKSPCEYCTLCDPHVISGCNSHLL